MTGAGILIDFEKDPEVGERLQLRIDGGLRTRRELGTFLQTVEKGLSRRARGCRVLPGDQETIFHHIRVPIGDLAEVTAETRQLVLDEERHDGRELHGVFL